MRSETYQTKPYHFGRAVVLAALLLPLSGCADRCEQAYGEGWMLDVNVGTPDGCQNYVTGDKASMP